MHERATVKSRLQSHLYDVSRIPSQGQLERQAEELGELRDAVAAAEGEAQVCGGIGAQKEACGIIERERSC